MTISFKKTMTLLAVVLGMSLSSEVSAQSLWVFSSKYTPKVEEVWTRDYIMPANYAGEGVIRAVDAEGKDLQRYEVAKDRLVAGPFKAGDAYLFEMPSQKRDAGSFVDFNMTFTIEDGAPMDWMVEVMDGGKWREGKPFRCYGPATGSAYRHSSVFQTFRLEHPTDGKILFRVRALDGYMRPSKAAKDGKEKAEGGAMFVSGSYLGVKLNDFGLSYTVIRGTAHLTFPT